MWSRMNTSRRNAFVASFIVFTVLASGCSPKRADIVVATIGEQPITIADYEALYIKSNGSKEHGQSASQEDREKFLDLMTKFRLKLTDAYASGLAKDPHVLGEIDQYKGSLAASYLTEREVTRPGLEKMFKKKSEEIRASHILLTLSANATAEESLATTKKADELIAAINAGASFDSLAEHYSQDPSAKTNKGDLYYFSAGQMVPPFEDAAFSMKVGEVSKHPVRTQFGLHVIKVTDKKKAEGERRVSHIMVRFDNQDPKPEDTLTAYAKIKMLQDSLKLGVDFAQLAVRNSEDPGSASRGGDLGQFPRRRYPQPFDEMAFLLKKDQVSPIVRTQYGYHLLKCTEVIPPKSFDEARGELQQAYQQQRFPDDFKAFVQRLKKELQFREDDKVVSSFINALDSTKSTRDSAWGDNASGSIGSQPMMWIGKNPVSVDSILAIVRTRPDIGMVPLRAAQVLTLLDKVAEHLVFSAKATKLEADDPHFAAIMKEYRDGILLYQVEQERVWEKITVNDSLLQSYFAQNREKFQWPDRVNISEIKTNRDTVAQDLYANLQHGESLESLVAADSIRMQRPNSFQAIFSAGSSRLSKQTLSLIANVIEELRTDPALRLQLTAYPDTMRAKQSNTRLADQRLASMRSLLTKKYGIAESRIITSSRPSPYAGTDEQKAELRKKYQRVDLDIIGRRAIINGGIQTGVYPISTDERTQRADSLHEGGITRPFFFKGAHVIVRLNAKEPARKKTYDEAGTEVSSAFQEYESKRLEQEWLDGLRKRFPVVEKKEALHYAFTPEP